MSTAAPPSRSGRIAQRVLVVALVVVIALLTARASGFLGRSAATDQVAWQQIDGAEAAALEAGKPILYDFTAEWCPPCQMMKRELFSHRKSAETIGQVFVPVQVMDRSREEGRNAPEVTALQTRFAVEAFPTLVVAPPGGGEPVILEGYGGREATLQALVEAGMKVGLAMRSAPARPRAAPTP